MKSKKQLLQILLDNIDTLTNGLCGLNNRLHCHAKLNHTEYTKLKDYITDNPPSKTYMNSEYYWKPGDKEPRINWLKEHIELNS